MQNIFVSYRRSDSQDVTGRIFDHLKLRFSGDRLFKDVESIPLGSDFRQVIAEATGGCDVLLVVIGAGWLSAKDAAGQRRLDDPDDSVHIEVRTALERNVTVIPVLVQGTTIPRPADLPEPLRPLAFRNAVAVRPDPDFRHDIERLGDALGRALGAGSRGDGRPSRRRLRWVAVAGALAAAAAGVALLALRHRPLPPPVTAADAARPETLPSAAANLDFGNLYFLGIGVNRYPNISRGNLQFADEDVMRLRETLKRYVPGTRKVEVTTLLNADATRQAVVGAIGALRAKLGVKDVGVVSFSGIEGSGEGGEFYLLPVDADEHRLKDTAISTRDVFQAMPNARGQVIFLLDTCHSGRMAEEMVQVNPTVVTFASCSADEISMESKNLGDQGGGVFTTAVIAGLEGEADADGDGLVSLGELGAFVPEKTRSLAKQVPGGESTPQNPVLSGDIKPIVLTAPGKQPRSTRSGLREAPGAHR